VAALFWTTVLALFCEMITNGNPELVDFQQVRIRGHLPHAGSKVRHLLGVMAL
jgi:hypothetical protein